MPISLQGEEQPWAVRQDGLYIFTFWLEHAGEASFNYQQLFVPHFVRYICDKQGGVRENAAYCVGAMAQHGGPNYIPALQGRFQHLASSCMLIVAP